ncbi:MAG: DUF5718 family protein, partial [Campylobacterales bacterium]
APKGLFPFYLPHHPTSPISLCPISHDTTLLPSPEATLQVEPEVA